MTTAKWTFILPWLLLAAPSTFANPKLIQYVEREYSSPEEASQKIGALARHLQKRGDYRGLFPAIYALTITSGNEALRKGQFKHPEWSRQLILNYANLYRKTIAAELRGQRDNVPYSWQLAFEYESQSQWMPELDAVYGINVHIARDLIEALFSTPTNFNDPRVKADYYFISDLLKSSMPQILAAYGLYPRLPVPDLLAETVMVNWIYRLRHQAWVRARSASTLSVISKKKLLDDLDIRLYWQAKQLGLLLPLVGN